MNNEHVMDVAISLSLTIFDNIFIWSSVKKETAELSNQIVISICVEQTCAALSFSHVSYHLMRHSEIINLSDCSRLRMFPNINISEMKYCKWFLDWSDIFPKSNDNFLLMRMDITNHLKFHNIPYSSNSIRILRTKVVLLLIVSKLKTIFPLFVFQKSYFIWCPALVNKINYSPVAYTFQWHFQVDRYLICRKVDMKIMDFD